MWVRIRDRLLNMDHVAEVDLNHRPGRGDGPRVQLTLAVTGERVEATGREAAGLREMFASLEEYFGHLESPPSDPLTVLSFDPYPIVVLPAEATTA